MGQSTGSAAQEAAGRAAEVSSVAAQQASEVASTAADQARQVGTEALAQTRNLLEEARQEVWRQGQAQTDRAVGGLAHLRDQARALLDGQPDEAGALVDQGRSVVAKLDEVTRRLESRGLGGVVDDLERFARRRPGVFLAAAGAMGFAAGRLVRANRDGGGAGRPRGSGDARRSTVTGDAVTFGPYGDAAGLGAGGDDATHGDAGRRVASGAPPPPVVAPPPPPPVPHLEPPATAAAPGQPPGARDVQPVTAPRGIPAEPPLPPEYLEGAP
jgi:hypothetical protein